MNIFQAFEQYAAFLRDLSPMLWNYKEDLKKQGFTENQAFRMALELQNNITKQGKQ